MQTRKKTYTKQTATKNQSVHPGAGNQQAVMDYSKSEEEELVIIRPNFQDGAHKDQVPRYDPLQLINTSQKGSLRGEARTRQTTGHITCKTDVTAKMALLDSDLDTDSIKSMSLELRTEAPKRSDFLGAAS